MIITVIVLMLLGAGCSVLAYMAGKDDGFEEGRAVGFIAGKNASSSVKPDKHANKGNRAR